VPVVGTGRCLGGEVDEEVGAVRGLEVLEAQEPLAAAVSNTMAFPCHSCSRLMNSP
jgi:hypothetical protein